MAQAHYKHNTWAESIAKDRKSVIKKSTSWFALYLIMLYVSIFTYFLHPSIYTPETLASFLFVIILFTVGIVLNLVISRYTVKRIDEILGIDPLQKEKTEENKIRESK